MPFPSTPHSKTTSPILVANDAILDTCHLCSSLCVPQSDARRSSWSLYSPSAVINGWRVSLWPKFRMLTFASCDFFASFHLVSLPFALLVSFHSVPGALLRSVPDRFILFRCMIIYCQNLPFFVRIFVLTFRCFVLLCLVVFCLVLLGFIGFGWVGFGLV